MSPPEASNDRRMRTVVQAWPILLTVVGVVGVLFVAVHQVDAVTMRLDKLEDRMERIEFTLTGLRETLARVDERTRPR